MEPFKNLLNEKAAKNIARALTRADTSFDSRAFLKGIEGALEPLELKQRVVLLKSRLHSVLPSDPNKSFPLLVEALKKDENDEVGLSSFLVWPLTRYVADHGLEQFDLSMKSLRAMTKVFTAEFDIRPFLMHYEQRTLGLLKKWANDPSEDVRRLVSEGTRPLLPWGERLPRFVKDPELTWVLLDSLRNDSSEYVRKSVANHINDHSKNHGDWVVERLKVWHQETERNTHLKWIIRHATRTLVKKGHKGALELHGVKASPIKIVNSKVLSRKIKLGESLRVQVEVFNPSTSSALLILDHEISFLKSNGKHQPKVFKGKKLELNPKETLKIECQIPIRNVTVRKHYPGKQNWSALLNGEKQDSHEFLLEL